jgi:hypothetical protein
MYHRGGRRAPRNATSTAFAHSHVKHERRRTIPFYDVDIAARPKKTAVSLKNVLKHVIGRQSLIVCRRHVLADVPLDQAQVVTRLGLPAKRNNFSDDTTCPDGRSDNHGEAPNFLWISSSAFARDAYPPLFPRPASKLQNKKSPATGAIRF